MDPLQALMAPPQEPTQAQDIGGMLQGLGAGFAGQPDPRIASQDAAFKQKLQLIGLQQSVEKRRMEKSRMQAELLGSLAKSHSPEARSYGVKGIFNLAKKSGAELPGELSAGLLSEDIKPGEVEEASKMIARGVSPQVISQTFPWATPQAIQGLTGNGADFLAMSYGWRTPSQLRKEAADADRKSLEAIRLEADPEMAGNSELQQLIHGAHKDLNRGQTYWEGTPESKEAARKEGTDRWTKAQLAKHPTHAGERIVTPQGGQYFNRKTRNFDPALPVGELESNRDQFVFVPSRDIELRGYAARSMPTLIEMKRLIPLLLAKEPVENIVQALKLEGAKLTSSNPDLRRLNALAFDANIEQVRALGGSSVVRQRLLELLSKHAGISTLDTQKTALAVVDASMINMENLRRTPVRDPIIRMDQRIGPGRYLVQDRKSGKKFIANVPEGQVTPPEWLVLENQ